MEIQKIRREDIVVINRSLSGRDLDLDRDDELVRKGTVGRVFIPNTVKQFTAVQLIRYRKITLVDVPAESLSPLNLKTFFEFVIPGAVASLGLNRVHQKFNRVRR